MLVSAEITFKEQTYTFNPNSPLDISIELKEGNENVNCYYAEPVHSEIIRAGSFVGSVAEGGSVNYRKISMTPHGNGTHTECYGHISAENITINESLRRFLFFSQLITIEPKEYENGDLIVAYEDFIKEIDENNIPEAIIIRTLPNSVNKLKKQYSGSNPPYLEAEICKFLKKNGINHLLIDLPSVDKEIDGGKLAAHKAFWNYPEDPRKNATITELIYVDSTIPDGQYLLNLQIISLTLDACPSKPILYGLEKK